MSESPYRGESAVRLALKAREARQQAKTLLGADPIAVVGMACRVPGGGSTPDKLWQVLRDGVDAVRDIPADRWDGDAWYDPDMAAPGKSITKQGGFIDAIDQFDAGYFDILPREAEQMDPQQRLLLEVAIEALDDAGLPQPALAGSRTGVYIASYHNDYAKLSYAEREAIDPRTLTGTLHSVLANRVSYFLDLRGPSLSVDTACSSSLVAIHLACQSLRFGECDVALAGGVSLIITPDLMVSMSKVGFMAPDGRCKTFDAHADGFGRGEGCGVIVLKRLADAISDEDRVLAVIRGSAVNQDGRSTLLAAPNGPAQEALIREALGNARIEPGRIGFVEAHGTGTALGDPIEVEAIAATIGRPAPGYGDCLLGSAKANLGHLEAAAGVVGTIKAVLALRNEAIPGQVHYTAPNPHMNLAGTRLTVPKALTPWPKSGTPRCAAISSFGVGGTNAHIILEEAPGLPAPESEGEGESWQILPLSAKSPAALESLLRDWTAFLDDTPASLADLTHSAALRRTHFTARTAVVGRTKQEVRDRLAARLAAPLALERANADAPRMCFVFSGQGTQWHGMARELMDAEPVFRDVMEECDALLLPLSGWSILERLALPEAQAQFDDTGIAQPLLFAIQTALAELLKSWGVAPDAVIGHSIGEIAALHAAGVIDRAEAIRIVWHRGRIMQPAKDRGAMALVSLAEADARALAARFPGRLDIGAVNAPRASVLTGEPAALEEALASLGAGIDRRRLPVSYAFHGGQMEPLRAGLAAALGPVRWSAPQVPVYSTVTGALAGGEAFDLGYVLRNVRQEVRFADAVTNAAKDGFDLFVEIGPHPALGPAIESCLDAADRPGIVLHTLRRAKPEAEIIRQCAAGLYAAGCDLDWGAILPVPGALTTLPAYPWQKRRHWLRRRTAQTPQTEAGGHPLLGRRIEAAGLGAQIFEGRSTGTESWLPDHRIFGRILMPAAAIIEALWSAAAQTGGDDTQLAGFALDRPLVVPEPEAGMARWQVVARPGTEGTSTLELHEDAAPDWRRIAGTQALSGGAPFAPAPQAPLGEPISEEAIYARFNAAGVAFGPTFRLLREVRLAENFASGAIALPDELAAGASAHALHPVMLDAAFQLCWLAADRARADGTPAEAFLPVSVDRLKIVPGRHGWLRAQVALSDVGPRGLTANVWITTEGGEAVAAVEGIQFVRADPASLAGPAGDLYDIGWETAEAVAPATLKGETLLLADAGGVAERLAAGISAAGGRCRLITAQAVPDAAALAAALGEAPTIIHLWSLDLAPGEAVTHDLDAEDWRTSASALALAQALAGREVRLSLVTRGATLASGTEPAAGLRPRAAGLWGLAGVIAAEQPELGVRVIDLDPAQAAGEAEALLREIAAGTAPRLALRGGKRLLPRLQRYAEPKGANPDAPPQRLVLAQPGTPDGLELRDVARLTPGADEVRIRVLAAGLNFRDVLTTLGMYPGEAPPLGVECAGIVTACGASVTRFKVGDRVFGYAPSSLATEAVARADFLARIPPSISAEDAAGLSVAYLTAHYGLHGLAMLQPGEKVLIHAAAGGVGLAAVQLALRAGAQVYATAGTPAKRDLLAGMGATLVADSRSLGFADAVLAATGGQGVDVVLNSLAGEFIPASLRVLAKGGRFLELGKRGIWTEAQVATERPDVSYLVYDLGSEAEARPGLMTPMYDDLLAALSDGSLKPLPATVFPLARIAEAMRYMAQARHVGKVVIAVAAEAGTAPAIKADATYWITGGLGGLGLVTADWLARSGARHLVLSGRNGPGVEASARIRALEGAGVRVHVVQADTADAARLGDVVDEIAALLPPLRGVIHAAGVVRDGVLAGQRWDSARDVLAGKAHGAFNLHAATRHLPLDLFVLYSAAGVVLGAAGQGLYPAANAELDALARLRRRAGLPALSVAWGLWSGIGMAAAQGGDAWAARGLRAITPATGFARLERLLADGAAYGAVVPVDWATFLAKLPAGLDPAFFTAVAPAERRSAPPPATATAPDLLQRLKERPAAQRRQQLLAYLTQAAVTALGIESATAVDPKAPLKDVGLDSLMAVELRNILVRSVGQSLPATLLFDYPTLEALSGYLMTKWKLDEAPTPAPLQPAPPPAAPLLGAQAIDELSDAEAEALLLQELTLGELALGESE